MTDRYMVIHPDTLEAMHRAGHIAKLEARIEKLEAALREVIDCWDWWQVDTYDRCASVPADAIRDARKALEGKDAQ